MRSLMDRAFARYGTPAQLENGAGQQDVRVFFHSINSRSRENTERAYFPLGEIPRGQYICVFPIDAEVRRGDTVTVGGRSYLVSRVEEMTAYRGPVYRWSLCVEKGGGETWG